MGWNRRDDGCNDHPKIRGLGRWEPDLLWQKAGVGCSKSKTGGLVEPADLDLYGFLAYLRSVPKLRAAVKALVDAELWHDATTVNDCSKCLDVLKVRGLTGLEKGCYLFHDWEACNPSKRAEEDDVTRFKETRARKLKDMVTRRAEVLTRDGEWCRYCAVRTTSRKNDQRSTSRRVLDHVDPMGDNSLGNLATACGRCNGRKRDRTPVEAEMPLLAPPVEGAPPQLFPDGYTPINANDTGPDEDPPLPGIAPPVPTPPPIDSSDDQSAPPSVQPNEDGTRDIEPETSRNEAETRTRSKTDRGPASCDTRDGPGRVRLGLGLVPASVGPGPVGSGQAGPGPGLVGLGRAGQALVGSGGAGSGVPPCPPSSTTESSDATRSPATTSAHTFPTGGSSL